MAEQAAVNRRVAGFETLLRSKSASSFVPARWSACPLARDGALSPPGRAERPSSTSPPSRRLETGPQASGEAALPQISAAVQARRRRGKNPQAGPASWRRICRRRHEFVRPGLSTFCISTFLFICRRAPGAASSRTAVRACRNPCGHPGRSTGLVPSFAASARPHRCYGLPGGLLTDRDDNGRLALAQGLEVRAVGREGAAFRGRANTRNCRQPRRKSPCPRGSCRAADPRPHRHPRPAILRENFRHRGIDAFINVGLVQDPGRPRGQGRDRRAASSTAVRAQRRWRRGWGSALRGSRAICAPPLVPNTCAGAPHRLDQRRRIVCLCRDASTARPPRRTCSASCREDHR